MTKGNGAAGVPLSAKGAAEQLAEAIVAHAWTVGDWPALLLAYFQPIAERLYVAGAVAELLTREAVLPGESALRKLHLFKDAVPRGRKDIPQRLAELGLVLPDSITMALPGWLQMRMDTLISELMAQPYWQPVALQVREDVAQVVKDGLAAGKGPGAIARDLRKAIPSYTKMRAERVARTETAGLLNAGQLAVLDETHLRTDVASATKAWLSVLDERTRKTHVEAHGQTVKLAEPFLVGGEQAMYPGDPNLSAGERINCRCAVIAGDVFAMLEG